MKRLWMSVVAVGVLVGMGWVAAGGQVESPAPELRFWLESSRQLCTEGTLTEIRWRGGDGGGNLWPHVNGRMIGENTYRVKVNCGMIPRTGDGELDQTQLDAVITGFLRDGRGTIKSASIRIPRAPALPAPIESGRGEHYSGGGAFVGWSRSVGGERAASGKREMLMLMRWKEPTDSAWIYSRIHRDVGEVTITTADAGSSGRYLIQAAELREGIEADTPDALQWSATIDHHFHRAPENLRATTTHDTLVIEWDAQTPSLCCYLYDVSVMGPKGGVGATVRAVTGQANRVMFTGMPADTEFSIRVITDRFIQIGLPSSITARTKAAPAGYVAPPRGPQNLRATATRRSITLRWEAPFDGANEWYWIYLKDEQGDAVAGDAVYSKPEDGFSYTFNGLVPNRIYRATVTHNGIIKAATEVQVSTIDSRSDSSADGATGEQGIPEPEAPLVSGISRWPIDIHNHPRPNPPL